MFFDDRFKYREDKKIEEVAMAAAKEVKKYFSNTLNEIVKAKNSGPFYKDIAH